MFQLKVACISGNKGNELYSKFEEKLNALLAEVEQEYSQLTEATANLANIKAPKEASNEPVAEAPEKGNVQAYLQKGCFKAS